jgi:hypothetical protein
MNIEMNIAYFLQKVKIVNVHREEEDARRAQNVSRFK